MAKTQIQRNVPERIRDLISSLKPEGKVELWNAFSRTTESPESIIYDENQIVPVLLARFDSVSAMTFSKMQEIMNACTEKSASPFWFTQTDIPYSLHGAAYNRPPVDHDALVCFLLSVCSAVKYNEDNLDSSTFSTIFSRISIDDNDLEIMRAFARILLLGYTVNELSGAYVEMSCPDPLRARVTYVNADEANDNAPEAETL